MWSKLEFGKHDGKTLPQVVLSDPDWFFWAIDNGVFDHIPPALRAEAKHVLRKATRIKIPKPDPENWQIKYIMDPMEKFHASRLLRRPDISTWVRVLPPVLLTWIYLLCDEETPMTKLVTNGCFSASSIIISRMLP
jgi:hypothetical protein